jgi:hypothetical protein
MLTFEKFTGVNNVVPSHRLKKTDLTVATNIDIGLDGELMRRDGYSELAATCHKNLWQADGFLLATVAGNDLKAFTIGGSYTTVSASLGPSRVWYCNLPDGRTTFSNGLINGITGGAAATTWGVPIPASLGARADVAGSLFPGDYQYQLTYRRTADGLESGPLYSNPAAAASGGISLSGLPTLAGHTINVYITGANGDVGFYAGNTAGSTFTFTGANDQLVLPCRTEHLSPAPVGTVMAFWRGRVLVAAGSVLWASMAGRWEHFNMRRDFKQFSAGITLIQPVDGGFFVGTTEELCFLAGTEFDKLIYTRKLAGATVLGSGVAVRGELIKQGEGAGLGSAMMCLADNTVVAGFSDGQIVRSTESRYTTTATEVSAVFRMVDRVPQYVAIPQ